MGFRRWFARIREATFAVLVFLDALVVAVGMKAVLEMSGFIGSALPVHGEGLIEMPVVVVECVMIAEPIILAPVGTGAVAAGDVERVWTNGVIEWSIGWIERAFGWMA